MPNDLIKIWCAALLTFGGLSAAAAEMPASGTKNFIPGGKAPSYFSNESGGVSTAASEESAADDGVDQISRSSHSDTGPRQVVADTSSQRHNKLSAYHAARRQMVANLRGPIRSAHDASRSRVRTVSVSKPGRQIRTASRTAGPRAPETAKTGTAREIRTSTNNRHAAAKSTSKRG